MNSKGKILIVDDSESILAYLSELLEDESYTTFTADSGELALAGLEKILPDLILLDVRMDNMDGFEVCKRITANKKLKGVPIIFLTGVTDIKDRIEGLKLGAVDYITKPFEKEELLARVKTHYELYSYNKYFRERTAKQLIEHEKLLEQQNIEYKKLNDKLTENEEELKKLNADKDRFISILAHDLKSPFNSLIGFLSLLINNLKEYDITKIEKQLDLINEIVNHTYDLLEDILLWARIQQGKLNFEPQKIAFSEICYNVIENLKLNAKNKNITINHFSVGVVTFFADKNMLKTILRNLISNAIKFTNIGGSISIYAVLNKGEIVITVSDNGIGISPEKMSKIFDATEIYTTEGTAHEKGTGLGLPLCKEFVEKHGGKIWLESEVGKGSDFKFSIPLNFTL